MTIGRVEVKNVTPPARSSWRAKAGALTLKYLSAQGIEAEFGARTNNRCEAAV